MLLETEVGSLPPGYSAVEPAQSNSNTVRASPNGVGVRVSTPIFDSRGVCWKKPSPRELALTPVAAVTALRSGIDWTWPLAPTVEFATVPGFGLAPDIQ